MSTQLKWRAPEPIQRVSWGGGRRIWYQTENELGEVTCGAPWSSLDHQPAATVWLKERGGVDFLGGWSSGKFALFTPGGQVSIFNPKGEKVLEHRLGTNLEWVDSTGGGERVGCLMVSRQGGELDPGIPLYEWFGLDDSMTSVVRIPIRESISPHSWVWDEAKNQLWVGNRKEDPQWRRFDSSNGRELDPIQWKVSPNRKEWVVDVVKVRNRDRTAVIEERPQLPDYRVGVVEHLGHWPSQWTSIGQGQGEYIQSAWNDTGERLAVMWQRAGYCVWEWYHWREGRLERTSQNGQTRKGRSESNHKGFWMGDDWVYVGEENEIFLELGKDSR